MVTYAVESVCTARLYRYCGIADAIWIGLQGSILSALQRTRNVFLSAAEAVCATRGCCACSRRLGKGGALHGVRVGLFWPSCLLALCAL